MKSNGWNSLTVVFLIGIMAVVAGVNLLVILAPPAHADPPKLNWVWVGVDFVHHCEVAEEDHCLPASAYTW